MGIARYLFSLLLDKAFLRDLTSMYAAFLRALLAEVVLVLAASLLSTVRRITERMNAKWEIMR